MEEQSRVARVFLKKKRKENSRNTRSRNLDTRVRQQFQKRRKPNETPEFTVDTNVRQKIRKLHDFIGSGKFYSNDTLDIEFDFYKTIPINKNGNEKVSLANESYCSNILLPLFVGLGINKIHGTSIAYGPPGTGKTTSAEYIGHFLTGESLDEIHNATIFGNPQCSAENMVARFDTGELLKGVEKVLPRAFITHKQKIIDEVRRIPPETLAILFQILDRGITSYGSEVLYAQKGPINATANEVDSGSFDMPDAFDDRFDIGLLTKEMNPVSFLSTMDRARYKIETAYKMPKELYLNSNSLRTIENEVNKVSFDTETMHRLIFFIAELNNCHSASDKLERKAKATLIYSKLEDGICNSCHYKKLNCAHTSKGVSPRAYQAILNYSATMAWFRGKNTVEQEDVEAILPFTLWHKLPITEKGIKKNIVYKDDRISWIQDEFKEITSRFVKYDNSIKGFKPMLEDIAELHKKIDNNQQIDKMPTLQRLENHLSDVIAKMDSVSKFSYARAVKYLIKKIK